MTKLYIAFGSNLCKAQMRKRAPGAKSLGKFTLTNARLVFRGVADVEFDLNSTVPCGLWRITPQDEKELDRYEGVGYKYCPYIKSEDIILSMDGVATPALIYLMTSQGVYPPTMTYLEKLRQGYKDFDLDKAYLDAALKHSYEHKAPTDWERERRQRQRALGRWDSRLAELPLDVHMKRLDAVKARPLDDWKPVKRKRPKTLAPAPKLALEKPEVNTNSEPRLTERNAVIYGD